MRPGDRLVARVCDGAHAKEDETKPHATPGVNDMLPYLLIGGVIAVTTALSMVAVIRFTSRFRRPRLLAAPTGRTPMVTVLKPLCGADDALEQDLESFFRQAGARYELVFGVEGDDDPRALRPAPR